MTPRPQRSAADLFDEALELALEARAAFLDAACAGQPELRAEVESLLAALPSARRFFEASPVQAAAGEWLTDLHGLAPGAALGPYRLLEPIASGGMGAVYLAERTDEAYRQRVAIKFLRPGLGGTKMLERFRTERQVLADLQHPGIAHLIDGGTAPGGLPYLVMEYVDGEPIDRHCRELPLERRLALFLDVCDAVQYAHSHLVVHRDLKPGNIFVDRAGRVRLLDFGIAKVLDTDTPDGAADHTVTELRAFTPRYASPEQARGEHVTTATDVYSLGLVLFELLTGRLPQRAAAAVSGTGLPPALGDVITRPSAAVDRRLSRRLAGDLDTIVLRALAWEPRRRYPTVEEFAADLRRHVAGQPVLARPDTAAYRISRFVRRNKAVAASVVGIVLTLAAALAVTTNQYRLALRSAEEARQQAYVGSIIATEASILVGNLVEANRRLAAVEPARRGWEWRHLHARADRSTRTWTAHRAGITHAAFARDGRAFATSSVDSTVALWDAASGRLLRRWSALGSGVETVALTSDTAAVAAGCSDGRVLLLAPGGGVRELLPRGDQWAYVGWSADARLLAAGFFSGDVSVWEAASGRLVTHFHAHPALAAVAFLPDGRLVSGGTDGVARLWDLRRRRCVLEMKGHARRIYDLAVSPDGRRLLTGSMDRTARVWSLADGRELSVFRSHRATVSAVAFHPDGERAATAASDHQCFVWDAATGTPIAELHGHTADVSALASSPDGSLLVSADWGGRVKEWAWDTQDVRTLRLATDAMVPEVVQAALDPRSGRLACAVNLDELPLWPSLGTSQPAWLPVYRSTSVCFALDGRLLAGRDSGTIAVCDPRTGRLERSFAAHSAPVRRMAFAPAGDRFATCGGDSVIALWSWPACERLRTLRSPAAAFTDLAFSPDGSAFVAAGTDGAIHLWGGGLEGPERRLTGHTGAVNGIAFGPDGVTLYSASTDSTVRSWDTRAGRALATLYRGSALMCVAVSPDGTRIAAGGSDTVVHLLDAASGQEIVGLDGHVSRVFSLAFSGDGHWLVSTSRDGTVRLWDD